MGIRKRSRHLKILESIAKEKIGSKLPLNEYKELGMGGVEVKDIIRALAKGIMDLNKERSS